VGRFTGKKEIKIGKRKGKRPHLDSKALEKRLDRRDSRKGKNEVVYERNLQKKRTAYPQKKHTPKNTPTIVSFLRGGFVLLPYCSGVREGEESSVSRSTKSDKSKGLFREYELLESEGNKGGEGRY